MPTLQGLGFESKVYGVPGLYGGAQKGLQVYPHVSRAWAPEVARPVCEVTSEAKAGGERCQFRSVKGGFSGKCRGFSWCASCCRGE